MIAAILGEVDEGIILYDLPSFLSNNKAISLAVVFRTSAYNLFRETRCMAPIVGQPSVL